MKMIPHLIRATRAFAAALLVCGPSMSHAATFQGEFWDLSAPNFSINQALNAISGVAPTATFLSTAIDYPNGNQNVQRSNLTLAQFLGGDAASIVGNGTAAITTSVFRFTGLVNLVPGTQNFALGSDDGFRLTLNNTVVTEQNTPRGFRFTTIDSDVGSGIVPFELIFYENFGNTGVEFFIDNVLAVPAPVPLPATLPLGLAALSVFGFMGWRRRGHQSKIPLANPA